MTAIPAELAASWKPRPEASTPRKVMDLIVSCAINGRFSWSIRSMEKPLGLERTTIQHVVNTMRADGAIVVETEGRGSHPPVYRIVNPDWSGRTNVRRWSPERAALMDRMWAVNDTPTILAAVNALPGETLSERALREYACRHKLRRSKAWISAFHIQTARRINAERAMKARANPKPKATRNHSKPKTIYANRAAPYEATITGRLASSVTLRTPGLRAGPGVVWSPGACQWPLTCHEPASGRFCADHGGMVRPRATRDDRMEAGE